MKKVLRPYQELAYKAVFDHMAEGKNRVIVVLPTGAGKTKLASSIATNFQRILFLSHTEELLSQSGEALLNEFYPEMDVKSIVDNYGGLIEYFRYLQGSNLFGGLEETNRFGIIKADLFKIDSRITIGSYQTIHRRLDRIPADWFDLVIVDECHMASAKTICKTLNFLQPKLMIGLSATPHREDGLLLTDIFDGICYQYSINDAINDGFLCEFDAIQIQTKLNLDSVRTTAGDFNQKDLKQVVDVPERNELLLEKYKQYADGLQSIVFCVDVEHAVNVHKVFTDAGEIAEVLVGDELITPDRKGVIRRFKSGETTHLINVIIGTTGFDYPGIKCIIDGAPTKSLTRALQKWGRGTRTLPGVIDGIDDPMMRRDAIKRSSKPKCILLDIVDSTSRHKIINTWELDRKKPVEKRTFTTSEKKATLIEARNKAKIAADKEIDRKINLFEVPTITYSSSERMLEDASPKQLEILAEQGHDVVTNNFTKAMAAQIISNLPASDKQVWFLKWKKYNVEPGLTYGQFQAAIKEIELREEALKPKPVSEQQNDLPF